MENDRSAIYCRSRCKISSWKADGRDLQQAASRYSLSGNLVAARNFYNFVNYNLYFIGGSFEAN